MPKFQKGKSGNPQGRKPGTPNKLTASFKQMLEEALEKIGPEGLEDFARKNPSAFFQVCSKLIPSEISAALTVTPAPPKTDEQAKAELTKLYSEDLAALMVGDITEEQYAERILSRKGKPEKEQEKALLEMNPEPTTH